jgi:hypothetical protein
MTLNGPGLQAKKPFPPWGRRGGICSQPLEFFIIREASLADKKIPPMDGGYALFLRPIATPFALKSPDNALLGAIRETSLFVRENGSVGTIQEIDLIA